MTDPLSNVTTFARDALGRIATVADAASNKIELAYDENSNVTQLKRRDWNQVTSAYDDLVFDYVYDDLDRLTTVTRHDPGNTLTSSTAREYDGRGLLTKLTDELGNTKHIEWDGHSRITKVVRDLRAGGTGAGAVVSTIEIVRAYDLGDRLTSIKDGLSNATSYEYDERSRVKKTTNAAGQYSTYTFDANGNVATATDPNGTVVTKTYDVMNRLTAQSAVPGTGVIGDTSLSLQYDALGRVTRILDDDSTIERTYDSLGRLLTEKQGPNPIGSSGKTYTFGYNAAGAITSITHPDGTVEQRNRDAIGRLSSVAIQGGATLATYQYSGGRVPSLTLQNNVVRTNTFDALFRQTHVEYKKGANSLKKFEYVFDLADHRLLEKRHHAGGTGDNYTLDSLYRSVTIKAGVADPVAEHQNPGSQTVTSTTAVTYDKANSRSQAAVNSGGTPTTTNYSVDALNFYTNVGGTTNIRDANGNLKDDGTFLYSYDYRNELVQVTKKSDSSLVATYEYDGIGRRISKSTGGVTTQFYWLGSQMVAEYDSQGLVSRRHYGAALGEVVSAYQRDVADLDQDGTTVDYLALTPTYDGAFDCVGVLDHTGAVAESYVHAYDGAVTIKNGAGGTIQTSAIGWQQGYGRMYRDSESGLLYALHRYYSPALGRFATEDPVGRWYDGSSLGNGYAFVANRYRNAWDPFGLEPNKGESWCHYAERLAEENDDEENHIWYLVYEWEKHLAKQKYEKRIRALRLKRACAYANKVGKFRREYKFLRECIEWRHEKDRPVKVPILLGGTIGLVKIFNAAINKITDKYDGLEAAAKSEYEDDLWVARFDADEINGYARSGNWPK